MSQHLYISPAMQVSIWPVVIILRLNSGPIHFSFKTQPQGKFFWQNPCHRDINLKETLWFFDKICGQMLNNFTALIIVLFYINFHVAMFYFINDLFSFILQLKYSYWVTLFIKSSVKQISDHHISEKPHHWLKNFLQQPRGSGPCTSDKLMFIDIGLWINLLLV